MRDYIDDFLAPDDAAVEAERGAAHFGIVVSGHAASSAELDECERRMFAEPPLLIEFREDGAITVVEYEQMKAAGLSPEDEILVLADLMTRIVYR